MPWRPRVDRAGVPAIPQPLERPRQPADPVFVSYENHLHDYRSSHSASIPDAGIHAGLSTDGVICLGFSSRAASGHASRCATQAYPGGAGGAGAFGPCRRAANAPCAHWPTARSGIKARTGLCHAQHSPAAACGPNHCSAGHACDACKTGQTASPKACFQGKTRFCARCTCASSY